MDDRKILELEPLPVARGYRRYRNAAEVRERHDAAYYLFEVYLKYIASVAIARYLSGEARDHKVNAALKGLARPSLGEWLRFLRECLRFLEKEEKPDPAIQAMATLFETKEGRWRAVIRLYNSLRSFWTGSASDREKVSLGTLLEEIVPYRNRVLGHGAPLGTEHYQQFGELLGYAFPELLPESAFLTARRLVSFESPRIREGSRVECGIIEFMGVHPLRKEKPLSLPYGAPAPHENALYLLSEDGSFLSLDPLLIAHKEDVYFLNEAEGTPEYLSYATGERHRPSDVGEAQQQLFERILGYHVDSTKLSRIGEDLAKPLPKEKAIEEEQRLGDYRIVREIGRGGMGTVFEAIQESLGRRVALKVLPGTFALDPKRLERFRREARATARIHHPNIVPVYEVGEAEGNHYYAMEYIDGPSLEELLNKARQESKGDKKSSSATNPSYIANVVEQMAALAEGLGEAHNQGLVHRDVKPSNILVDKDGRYILVDFGLVHEEAAQTITRSGEMIGTLTYMSPEQVSRRKVDARSDVYSLGATLYETLTLQPPFHGDSDVEVQNAILFHELTFPRKLNPKLNRDLETIIIHALEKNPERRYASAGELADDLNRLLRYETIQARSQFITTKFTRYAWRNKVKISLVLLLACLLLTLGMLYRKITSERYAQYGPNVISAIMKMPLGGLAMKAKLKKPSQNLFQLYVSENDFRILFQDAGMDPVKDALAELKEAQKILSGRPDAFYHSARAHLILGHEALALEEIEQTLSCDAGFIPARVLKASILEKQGKVKEAEAEIDLARDSARGDWADDWLSVYRAIRENKWTDAVHACDRLLGIIEVGGREPYLGFSHEIRLERGLALLEARKFIDAILDFSSIKGESRFFLEPVLLIGKSCYLMGEKQKAEESFLKLFEQPQVNRDEVAFGVTTLYLEFFEYNKALEWINKVRVPHVRDRIKAAIYYSLGKYNDAFAVAKKAAEAQPENPRAHQILGFMYYFSVNNPPEAESCMRKALSLSKDDPYSHFLLGYILDWRGKLNQAIVEYQEAFSSEPGNSDYCSSLANVLCKVGKTDEGFEMHDLAISLDVNNPVDHLMLGKSYMHLGNHDMAIEAFDRAIRLDPNWVWPHFYKCRILGGNRGKYSEAEPVCNEALMAYPKLEDAPIAMGETLWAMGRPNEAISFLNETSKKFPQWDYQEFLLGELYFNLGENKKAIHSFEEATRRNPYPAGNYRHLGIAYEREGMAEEAIKSYCQSIKSPWALQAHKELWNQLRVQGKPSNLARELDGLLEWLEIDADSIDGNSLLDLQTMALGWIYHPENQNVEKALKYAHDAVEESGERNPAVLLILAEVLERAGNLPEAIRVLEKALSLPDADPFLEVTLWRYRQSLLPQIASITSVDAFQETNKLEILIDEDSEWAFFRGKKEPPRDWKDPDFADSLWERDKAGFGYGINVHKFNFLISDMAGFYGTFYVRHSFQVNDLEQYRRLWILVWADDGFVAYVNGKEVGRARAGKQRNRVSHDSFASGESSGLVPVRLDLDAKILRDGQNCVAIQGLNQKNYQNSFYLNAILLAEKLSSPKDRRLIFENFNAASRGEDAQKLLLYHEGRLLQYEGKHQEAVTKFSELLAKDKTRPEPFCRITESLRLLEESSFAEKQLREAMNGGLDEEAELWDLWFLVSALDLGRSLTEILASMPPGGKGRGSDLRWILEELRDDCAVRINCGGSDYRDRDGLLWGKDRFLNSGLGARDETRSIADTENDTIYQTETFFPRNYVPPYNYHIPLPLGRYRIRLHFAEIFFREDGKRSFDVLLEGKVVRENFQPKIDTAEVVSSEETITDAFLDIEFIPILDNPKISAIEIEPIRD